MADMIEMKTLTIDGVTYEVVDETARESVENHEHLFANGVTTEGTGDAYTATVPGITELVPGLGFIMIPHITSTTKQPTLNVNGLGAKSIKRLSSDGYTQDGYSDDWLYVSFPYYVIFTGNSWVVQNMTKPIVDDLDIIPIEKGGTGASEASRARINLGITPANIGAASIANAEEWVFTLADGSTVSKEVILK